MKLLDSINTLALFEAKMGGGVKVEVEKNYDNYLILSICTRFPLKLSTCIDNECWCLFYLVGCFF